MGHFTDFLLFSLFLGKLTKTTEETYTGMVDPLHAMDYITKSVLLLLTEINKV